MIQLKQYIQQVDDLDIIFFPYVKTLSILPTVLQLKEFLFSSLPPIVFSHNNIYISDAFLVTPMISKRKIEKYLEKSIILFNGHIHRSYYEPAYYQVGSSIPTSFKETPLSTGTCIYSNSTVEVIRNNKIMLLSISQSHYLKELEWYLNEAINWGTMIFLKIGAEVEKDALELVKKYKDCVPGIMFESTKHS